MHKLFLLCLLAFPLAVFSQVTEIELEARTIPEPTTIDTAVDHWNRSQPGYDKLSREAKQLYYWTNYARNNPKKFWDSAVAPVLKLFKSLAKAPEAISLRRDLLINTSVPLFVLNPKLVKTAQQHASDIGGKMAPISHTSTNGTDFGQRMKLADIKHCANENISVSSQSVLLSVILLHLDIRLPNLGHRKTLLDANLREIGVGAAPYGEEGRFFLVQDFACAQN